MCGICGIVSLDDRFCVDPELVHRMAGALSHRGPDEQRYHIDADKRFALGFCRLSIIDLENAHQPVSNETDDIYLTCNGEIYNYQKLRADLIDKGHHLRNNGDIEPIVHLYEDMDSDFLDKLDGFFALALLDDRKKKLTLAVDRMGKKPLYYTTYKGLFYFASELKAITAVLTEKRIDNSSLVDYLRFSYVPAPKTIFENIYKLPPSHKLELNLRSCQELPPPRSYYTPSQSDFDGDYDQAKSKISELLTSAVQKRLIADVPVGLLLSGGLDSAIITAIASQNVSSPIKTFSVGFKNELYNELPLASLVAKRYRTDHTELMVEPDAESALDLVSRIYDEPFADSSAIPSYLICQKASEFVKVVLTGDGGDEAFAGYDRYRGFNITALLSKYYMGSIGSLMSLFLRSPGSEQRSKRSRAWRMIQALRHEPKDQYSLLMRLFYEDQLVKFAGPTLKNYLDTQADFVAEQMSDLLRSKSPIQSANLCDIKTYLPGDLLVKMDRASMACSLEARSPMLDVDLISFAISLPDKYRCAGGHGKKILRDVFGPMLPPELLTAPKRGFGVPMADWLRGPLRSQAESILHSSSEVVTRGLLSAACLKNLQSDHIAGKFDNSARIWSLMVLENFLRAS